jgi:hypothetical protein
MAWAFEVCIFTELLFLWLAPEDVLTNYLEMMTWNSGDTVYQGSRD